MLLMLDVGKAVVPKGIKAGEQFAVSRELRKAWRGHESFAVKDFGICFHSDSLATMHTDALRTSIFSRV